ncbi:alpha/beta hydrolase family protein [Flavobacterium sp. 1]|uniref:alpha/beta hydrolase n=1 Tax=Flavobacterium sp. 1 TaxID=2035200 RepID=UPI0018E28879|nr:alpha/beta hydrolase-fold protein [Flavobacterium sp. 1]
MKKLSPLLFLLAFICMLPCIAKAQDSKIVKKGTVIHTQLYGHSLEGNLSNDTADRSICVYLPPSYKQSSKKRYPVVYFLHGFTDNDTKWYGLEKHWIDLPAILDSLNSNGHQEMIFVTADAKTRFGGSMYSNSATTGNWEDYISTELVNYVDSHYRTFAKPSARGIAGHSMGGYGALRIALKHPEVFSSLYLLSPASLAPFKTVAGPADLAKMETVKTVSDFEKADFALKYAFASAAAWSPNPNNPPFFIDLPVKSGKPVPEIMAKWSANAPLVYIDQYISALAKMQAIGFDAGDKDAAIALTVKSLDSTLTSYNIQHSSAIYEGTHIDHIGQRIKDVMVPFFEKNLKY